MTTIRPKLLILGDARHGKDTVGDWFVRKGYTFVSSSRFVLEKAVWPEFKNRASRKPLQSEAHLLPFTYSAWPDYFTQEECFADRDKFRAFWFECITAYNRPDRSRLGRELFAEYDMYVGLRNKAELQALKLHKAYDLAIWVDAFERCDSEPISSMTINYWDADVVIDNNGTLKDLDKTLVTLYDKWIRPLEKSTRGPRWVEDSLDTAEIKFDGPVIEHETILWQKGKSELQASDILRFNETGEVFTITRIGAHLTSDDTTLIEVRRATHGTKAGLLPVTVVHATIIGSIPPAGF